MPLLEVQQIKKVTTTITLEQSIAASVNQYAAFVHATADEVVNKALDYVFSKDKEFQSFQSTEAAKNARSSLRVKAAKNGVMKPRKAAKTSASGVAHA